MSKEPEFNSEPLEDYETESIASLIKEGYTSGRLDGEGGRYVYWELKTNVWED